MNITDGMGPGQMALEAEKGAKILREMAARANLTGETINMPVETFKGTLRILDRAGQHDFIDWFEGEYSLNSAEQSELALDGVVAADIAQRLELAVKPLLEQHVNKIDRDLKKALKGKK